MTSNSDTSPDTSLGDFAVARPLSPHIQIYRWTLTMALSILHRATGVSLYAGSFLLIWWLVAAAQGPESYLFVQGIFSAWYGRLVLCAYTWAVLHHMFGGLRHFIWDVGRGFEPAHIEWLARFHVVVPIVLTILVWVLAYTYMGVL